MSSVTHNTAHTLIADGHSARFAFNVRPVVTVPLKDVISAVAAPNGAIDTNRSPSCSTWEVLPIIALPAAKGKDTQQPTPNNQHPTPNNQHPTPNTQHTALLNARASGRVGVLPHEQQRQQRKTRYR
jgi:hypothetical protein